MKNTGNMTEKFPWQAGKALEFERKTRNWSAAQKSRSGITTKPKNRLYILEITAQEVRRHGIFTG
jgi:hypothetical protein